MDCACADPLSNYPTADELSELKLDQWFGLGLQLGLTENQLERFKKSLQPTAATLLAAKVKNIDLIWKHVVESVIVVGEYKVAASVCSQQGWCLVFTHLSVEWLYYQNVLQTKEWLFGTSI